MEGRDAAGEVSSLLDKKTVDTVVDQCFQCKLCVPHCPYTPPHRWEVDFPRLMLRAKAARAKTDGMPVVDRVLANPDAASALSIARNRPIPSPGELSATLLIELQDSARIREELPKFYGLDRRTWLELDDVRVAGVFEGGRAREDKVSAIQYVRFPLGEHAGKLGSAKSVRLVIDHQKEAVLRAALASRDHPTADMIYAAVRRELPRVSLGTVYRNLQRLVVEGRISLAPVQDDTGRSARFDPETRPHDHFVCQRCKRIYDVARDGASRVDLGALEMRGFQVTSHTLAVYGVCPDCAEAAEHPRSRRGAK